MANKELIEGVKDAELRKYLEVKLDELVSDVRARREGVKRMPKDARLFMETAGTAYYNTLIPGIVSGISMEAIIATIQKAVWNVFCKKDNEHGTPRPEVLNAFNEGEKGAELIEKIIVGALVALAASVTGGFLNLVASGAAKWFGELVALWVAKILDKEVEDGFTKFCKVIPAD
jgi:hypothetical protein